MNDDSPDKNVESPISPSGSKRRFDLVDIFTSRLSMGPRKKSKGEPTIADTTATSSSSTTQQQSNPKPTTTTTTGPKDADGDVAMTDRPSTPKDIPGASSAALQNKAETRSSWYGSWTTKARPVTELAKESALSMSSTSTPVKEAPTSSTASLTKSTAGSVKDMPITPLTRRAAKSMSEDTPSPKRHFSGSIKGPSRGTPLAAVSNISIASNKSETKEVETSTPMDLDGPTQSAAPETVKETAPLPPDPPKANTISNPNEGKDGTNAEAERPKSASGWFGGWWSRPDGYSDSKNMKGNEESKEQQVLDEAKGKPLPAVTPSESTPDQSKMLVNANESSKGATEKKEEVPAKPVVTEDSKGWFGLWSKAQNVQTMSPTEERPKSQSGEIAPSAKPPVTGVPVASAEQATTKDQESAKKESTDVTGKRKPTGWAFWSKDSEDTGDGNVNKQVGELAVANTPSQTNPEIAQFNEIEEPKPKKGSVKGKKGRGRPKVTKDEILLPSPAKTTPATSPSRGKTQDLLTAAKGAVKPEPQNLLLPEFSKTYSLVQQQSIWQHLKDYFVGGEAQHPHLHIVPNPPRIKKALAIGVHGFFPAAFLQSLLGPPTGTSIRFANNAAAAIKAWTESKGYECEIEKVALEGEGLIADRVDTLWKLLLNWIEHVRSADFILVACHSQGVPVSVMLVEKLIEFKCLNPNAKIGICAMAGVNMGPFQEYKTQLFGKSALELFDFSRQDSKVSKMYLGALEGCLKWGVKIVYVGSMDDQLVSLDSSTFSNVGHPCVYRAVFVDGRLFTADFITELVGFALKLRNLGLPDHGLIRELSPALAGSLVSGEGHSRLYDSIDLYSLAVSHALETTTPTTPLTPTIKPYEGPAGAKDASGSSNPFYLPWAMRGILEEDKVRKELGDECARLLALFEDWKPVGKGLKDVKFRLEALRSKL